MAGRFALCAKVFFGDDQASAKEVAPEPVGSHACRQRVAGIDDPFGNAESRTWQLFAGRVETGWKLGCDLLPFLKKAASKVEFCLTSPNNNSVPYGGI